MLKYCFITCLQIIITPCENIKIFFEEGEILINFFGCTINSHVNVLWGTISPNIDFSCFLNFSDILLLGDFLHDNLLWKEIHIGNNSSTQQQCHYLILHFHLLENCLGLHHFQTLEDAIGYRVLKVETLFLLEKMFHFGHHLGSMVKLPMLMSLPFHFCPLKWKKY